MNRMSHNNKKKLNGNEKDDDDCHNLGNLKFNLNGSNSDKLSE